MKVSKALIFFIVIGICIIGFSVNAVNASDEICFQLSFYPYPPVGSGPTILRLGGIDYGNYHVALSGTGTSYVMPGVPDSVGLVHGNADIVNDKVEVSLSGTLMWSDNKTVSVYSYHLRLDPATLSGTYTAVSTGSISPQTGPVEVVSCAETP